MTQQHDATDKKPVPPQHTTAGAAATRPSGPEQERQRRVEQAAEIAPDPAPSTPKGGRAGGDADDAAVDDDGR